MPRTFPIMYPALEVQQIIVSSLPGSHPAATAQHWLERGHYIFDAATKKPLTVWHGELCTIVYPARVRTQPLAFEHGGSSFDISRYRFVYTGQIQAVDRAIGYEQRARLAAGASRSDIPRIRGWRAKTPGTGQFNHPRGILRLENQPDSVLEPAERAAKAWLRIKVPFLQAADGVTLAVLVAGSRSTVKHPRSVGSADEILAREAPKANVVGRPRSYSV